MNVYLQNKTTLTVYYINHSQNMCLSCFQTKLEGCNMS